MTAPVGPVSYPLPGVPLFCGVDEPMWSFARRNLLTRPMRTALGLVGLSIPILGVLGLFSLSGGMRNLVADTLSQIQGVMVVRENVPTPVFSDLPAGLADDLRRVPGVRVVAAEIWKVAPPVEGMGLFQNWSKGLSAKPNAMKGLWEVNLIQGEEIATHRTLKSAIGPKSILPPERGGGRYLDLNDRGQPHIVISTKTAEQHRDAEGRPKKVGDTLTIGGKPFTIVGLFETGSVILDVIIIMDIGTARELLGVSRDVVSSFYVEADDPGRIEEVTRAIEAAHPTLDARQISEFQAPYGLILDQLDSLLLLTVSLAVLVGVVGIVNTMLMSTTERFAEFGVLRTNGWSRGNVLTLVTAESAGLGLLSGLLGSALAWSGVTIANQFLDGGLRLSITPWLFATGIGLSLLTGVLGGLYPAWRAARLVPMDAIRLGSH
jgi:putative ABC transport system permease protein